MRPVQSSFRLLRLLFALSAILIVAAPQREQTVARAAADTPNASVPNAETAPQSTRSDDVNSDWFKVSADTLKKWTVGKDTADGLRLTITPKDASQLTGDEKSVLVLYFKPSTAYETAMSKLLEVFYGRNIRASFTALYFQGKVDQGQAALEYAKSKRFDLIYSMGSEATDFVQNNFRNGPIPVVTIVSKDPVLLGQIPDYDHGSGTNIAYTSVGMPIDVQMTYLKQLNKDIKNIAVVYADSNKSSKDAQVKPLKDAASAYGLNIFDVVVLDDKKAKEELAAKAPMAIAEMSKTDPEQKVSIFWVTAATSIIESIDALTRNAGKTPVISAFPDIVKEGDDSAVFSLGVSFESNSYLAAVYGADILAGRATAGDLKVGVISPPDIAINFGRARKIGLKIPFSFFESATFVYDYQGKTVRKDGQVVRSQ